MANMHHRKLPVKIGLNEVKLVFRSGDFDTVDKERSGRPKTIEDTDLQMLLDEDDTQTQEQLAEALNMTCQGISKRLHAMGKIQKEGKWVPHELTERQIENRSHFRNFAFAARKKEFSASNCYWR